MRLTQRLLVLLITVSMLLSGSFVQTFAADEAVDGSSVVASETSGPEDTEEPKEESGKEAKAEEPEAEETKEAAPEKEEPKAEAKTNEDTDAKAEPEEEASAKDESEDNKELSAGTLTYECDDYTVTLDYSKNAGIPEGTTLKVREILADSNDKAEKKEYSEYHDETLDALKKDSAEDIASLGFARFFDITLISDGKEIEPKGDVNVKIEFSKNARETVSKTEDAENKLRVVHITENDKTGELKAAALDKKDTELSLDKKELSEASFTTDSFSVYGIVYTVDFEYEGYAFSIKGESEILISELFEQLHIEEDASKVENVEFTDYELIKVEQTDGDWKLISLKPFDTEEKLTITLPEKIIEIKVTDAQNNNTFLLTTAGHLGFDEEFRVRLYSSRAGVGPELVGKNGTEIPSGSSNGVWISIDDVIADYSADISSEDDFRTSRYSVISAIDSGTSQRKELCAVGFGFSGMNHASCGLFTESDLIGRRGNSSGAGYDLDITLNDNSLPIQVYINGEPEPLVNYVNNEDRTQYTVEDLVAKLNTEYTDYIIESSKIRNSDVYTVNVNPLTGTSLAGNPFDIRWTYIDGIYRFNAFSHTYKQAYQWTYGTNNTNVGNGPYEIRLASPIARVKSGNGDWTYHSKLIDSGTLPGSTTKIGAFDQANSLSGDVVVEMLYDDHARYTLDKGFTFNNANIKSLTINGTSNKTTLVKDQTTGTVVPMITTKKIDTVDFNDIIFNGNNNATSNNYGGAVMTDAGTLTVSNCKFINCQAGVPGDDKGQGGGFCHQNTNGTVTVNNCVFDHCKAGGNIDNQGAGGGGFFTDALILNVDDTVFEGCTTHRYQGAGFFHKRKNETNASQTNVTKCKFNSCVSVWSGGGMESDARTVTVTDTEFYGCQATHADGGKGGAINVWANGENNTIKESSLLVSGCTFGGEEDGAGCTAQDNGGAIRSTAVNTTIENSTFTKCSAAKSGGAVAYTNDRATSTIQITGCSFSDCTAGQNGGAYFSVAKSNTTINETSEHKTEINGCSAATGGAIWSGILTMNAGTISNCSASANGGAIHGEVAITMNGGTISNCYTAGNGGAIDEKTDIIVNGGTISNCNAAKGGAIYSTKTITMTGGEVTGCTTSGDSAAVDAVQDKPGIFLEGNVVIKDNKGSAGEARDVYLGIDSDRHIQINENGLGNNANIGIYAAEGAAFNKHGKPGQLFARTGTGNNDGTGGYLAAQMRNLDKLFSDRLDNGPMHGTAAIEGSGDNWEYRVMWSTETPVAPTGYNSKYIPFLLILAGGAVLIMLKKTADRRRSEDDTDEE